MISQVRFHGGPQDVPAAFRDPQPATIEGAKLRCTQLEAEKACLDKQLGPLLDRIQAGTATPEEMSTVADLAEDSRILADRLHHAQIELRVAEEKAGREQSATARARFNFLVAEDRQQRAKLVRLHRDACIVLGRLCAGVDEAAQIANSFVGVAGMNPLDKNAVTEMSETPDPLPALLDSGFAATTGFGWNLRLSIVPLQKKG